MSKKAITKDEQSTSLSVLETYDVLAQDPEEFKITVDLNLGGERIDVKDLDLIKMPSGGAQFWQVPSLEGGSIPAKELTGIIIHQQTQRAFWLSAFSGANNPPDCFSKDGMRGIGNPGGACDGCEFSQFGTAHKPDGSIGKGQACRQVRLIFLLTPDSFLPAVVRLSPTSLQAHKKYCVQLASQSIPYTGVITRIGLKEEKSGDGIKYSEATFALDRKLEKEEVARVRLYAAAMRPLLEKAQTEIAATDED